MTSPRTIECRLARRRADGARSEFKDTSLPVETIPVLPGRVPRISRLMALALRFEQLIQEGVVANYVELAALGHVSRARITQIMSLLLLAPEIQEDLLFLPRTERGRDPIVFSQVHKLDQVTDWRRQRMIWKKLQQRGKR